MNILFLIRHLTDVDDLGGTKDLYPLVTYITTILRKGNALMELWKIIWKWKEEYIAYTECI